MTLPLLSQAPEIPTYGAKCLAVRNGILDLHGRQRVAWTKLARTAMPGNTTIHVTNPVDWEARGPEG